MRRFLFISKIRKFITRNSKRIKSLFLIISSASHILWSANKVAAINREKDDLYSAINIKILQNEDSKFIIEDVDKLPDLMFSPVSFATTSTASSVNLGGIIFIKSV